MTMQADNNNNETENSVNETGGRRSRRGLFIGIGAGLVIILIVALVAGFFFIRGSETQSLEDGRAAVDSGQWSVAEAALNLALAKQPAFLRQHDLEAAALRGLALYQLGEYDDALLDFETALESNADLADVAVYRADILHRQGDDEGALAGFAAALEHQNLLSDPFLALVHADQAAIYYEQGQEQKGRSEAAAAIELGQYLPEERIAALYAAGAQSSKAAGEVEESMTDSLAALSFGPALEDGTRADLLAGLAAIYFQEGRLDLALESSASALALDALADDSLAELYQMRAEALFQKGGLDGAIAEAELAVESGQDEALLHALQAVKYDEEGDWEEALEEAETALAIDENNGLAHRVRGSIYAWQGRNTEALAELDKAIALNEKDVEALAMRVYAQLERNDPAAAEADLAQAQQANPAAPATIFAEALVRQYNYDYAEVRVLLDLAIELDETRPEFYTQRAQTYRRTAEDERRMADLEKALALDQDFPWALSMSLSAQVDRYEYENVEEEAGQLIAQYPELYVGYGFLADHQLYRNDDPETAMTNAEKMIELAPESTSGYMVRGYIHLENEDYDLARADFERALEIAPNSLNAVSGLANLHRALEEYEAAWPYLEQYLAEVPDSTWIRLRQALFYAEQEDIEQTWQKVHEALAQDPEYPEALTLRAAIHMDHGDLDRAQLDLHKALELYPSYAWGHLRQAWVYLYQGREDEARQSAERALELEPRLTDAYLVQMAAAWAEEDFEAIESLAQAWVEAEPDSAVAHYYLGEVYQDLGMAEEALDSFNTAFELLEDEDDPLTGDIYNGRAMAYYDLSERELAEAELKTALSMASNLEFIDQAEVMLARPGAQMDSVDGRTVIEDPDMGYTISFGEMWEQWPADPEEGHVLSLVYGDDMILASADVVIITWDPEFSIDELAAYLDPAGQGGDSDPTEEIELGGHSGLTRAYEMNVEGETILGRHYMVTVGDRAAVIILESLEDVFDEFEEEFEAMVASFNILP